MIISFKEFTVELALNKLKQTASVDDKATGEINPEYRKKILSLTNRGLTDMFTRKKILEGRAMMKLDENTHIYRIDPITDPHYQGFVKILQVEAVPKHLELERDNREKFIPRSGEDIEMSDTETFIFSERFLRCHHLMVDIVFQKKHPIITAEGNINVPAHLLEALYLYVSGHYLTDMGSERNATLGDRNIGFYYKHLNDDMMNNSSSTSEVFSNETRFRNGGYP